MGEPLANERGGAPTVRSIHARFTRIPLVRAVRLGTGGAVIDEGGDDHTAEMPLVESAARRDPIQRALLRYRVMTYIVGSALVVLVFVGVPLQIWAHFSLVAKVEGTIHGYLYLAYLFTAGDLARRAHWRLGRLVAVVLSGFVPGLAFVVEHRVVQQMKAESQPEVWPERD